MVDVVNQSDTNIVRARIDPVSAGLRFTKIATGSSGSCGLTPTGTAVIVGGESKGNITGGIGRQLRALLLTPFIGQRLTGLASKERGSDSETVAEQITAGTVTPSIDRTYPLDQAPTAMRQLEAGTVKGKIAITL